MHLRFDITKPVNCNNECWGGTIKIIQVWWQCLRSPPVLCAPRILSQDCGTSIAAQLTSSACLKLSTSIFLPWNVGKTKQKQKQQQKGCSLHPHCACIHNSSLGNSPFTSAGTATPNVHAATNDGTGVRRTKNQKERGKRGKYWKKQAFLSVPCVRGRWLPRTRLGPVCSCHLH